MSTAGQTDVAFTLPKRQGTWLKWPLNEAQASGLPHPRDQKPPLKDITKRFTVLGLGQNYKYYDFRKQLNPLGVLRRWAVLEISVLGQDILFPGSRRFPENQSPAPGV